MKGLFRVNVDLVGSDGVISSWPWHPPPGHDLSKYDLGPVFGLFAAFQPHAGRAVRTQRATVDGLRALLQAAIVGGMRWTSDDATAVSRCFSFYGGHVFRIDEEAYALAVSSRNTSACVSMEKLFGVPAWRWPYGTRDPETFRGSSGERVAVGSEVWFRGTWGWYVTSLHSDHLVICWYEVGEDGIRERQPGQRKSLSKADLEALPGAGFESSGGAS